MRPRRQRSPASSSTSTLTKPVASRERDHRALVGELGPQLGENRPRLGEAGEHRQRLRTVHPEARPAASLLLLLVQPGEQVGHRRAAVQTRRAREPLSRSARSGRPTTRAGMLERLFDRLQLCVHPGVHVRDLRDARGRR